MFYIFLPLIIYIVSLIENKRLKERNYYVKKFKFKGINEETNYFEGYTCINQQNNKAKAYFYKLV